MSFPRCAAGLGLGGAEMMHTTNSCSERTGGGTSHLPWGVWMQFLTLGKQILLCEIRKGHLFSFRPAAPSAWIIPWAVQVPLDCCLSLWDFTFWTLKQDITLLIFLNWLVKLRVDPRSEAVSTDRSWCLHPLIMFAYPRWIHKDDPSVFTSPDSGGCQGQLQSLGLYYSTDTSGWTEQTLCTCFTSCFTRCSQLFTAGTTGTRSRGENEI